MIRSRGTVPAPLRRDALLLGARIRSNNQSNRLGDDDQPAAACGRALPGILDIGERDLLARDAQLGTDRPFHELRYRFHDTVERDGDEVIVLCAARGNNSKRAIGLIYRGVKSVKSRGTR